jgi:hypothetical protein
MVSGGPPSAEASARQAIHGVKRQVVGRCFPEWIIEEFFWLNLYLFAIKVLDLSCCCLFN